MTIYDYADKNAIDAIIKTALAEDIGSGDITTNLIALGNERGSARLIAKDDFILAGVEALAAIFQHLDDSLKVSFFKRDGERCQRGEKLAAMEGALKAILAGERVALNFAQRMSGIATMTAAFVKEIAGTKARLLDTRKTMPGLRILDKYAVRAGGGHNHRFALYDDILIKENHIALAGGIKEALRRAKLGAPSGMKIEIEVSSLEGLEMAIQNGADIVMLDNMGIEQMREAVAIAGGRVMLEASGNITLFNARAVVQTGVDFISVGALTHSVKAADISLLVDLI